MASLTLTAQDLISYLCKMHVSLQYRVMNYGVLSVPMHILTYAVYHL